VAKTLTWKGAEDNDRARSLRLVTCAVGNLIINIVNVANSYRRSVTAKTSTISKIRPRPPLG
jgi:hypothetical protein